MADEQQVAAQVFNLTVRAGSTNISIQIPMVDATDGMTPETGLTVTDFDLTYARPHTVPTKADCVALASPAIDDPHLDNGCFEIDNTNMKGVYRFDIPDAPFAAGEENALVMIKHDDCRSAVVHISLDTVEVETKTGFSLAATGLDAIAITDPGGVADSLAKMIVQIWRKFFKKATQTATELKTYADNGTTVRTTQTLGDDATTQTQGAAS